jgi:hypothetical protein
MVSWEQLLSAFAIAIAVEKLTNGKNVFLILLHRRMMEMQLFVMSRIKSRSLPKASLF